MRRDILQIIGITAVVVLLVLFLAPTLSRFEEVEPERAASIPMKTSVPEWAPTPAAEPRMIRVIGRAEDSERGESLPVRVALFDEEGRKYTARRNEVQLYGIDCSIEMNEEPAKAELTVVGKPDGYEPLQQQVVCVNNLVELGTVRLERLPQLRIWMPWGDPASPDQVSVFALSEAKANPIVPPYAIGQRVLIAIRHDRPRLYKKTSGYYCTEVTLKRGFNDFRLEPQPTVAMPPPLLKAPSGLEVSEYAYEIDLIGPYGVRLPLYQNWSDEESPFDDMLFAGDYEIRVTPFYSAEFLSARVSVSAADSERPLFNVMEPPAIRVRVLRGGTPVPDLPIELVADLDFPEGGPAHPDRAVRTDLEGEVLFQSLHTDTYTVRGVGIWYELASSTAVAGSETLFVVELEPPGRSTLQATIELPKGFESRRIWRVELTIKDSRTPMAYWVRHNEPCELRGIPYGEYTLEYWFDDDGVHYVHSRSLTLDQPVVELAIVTEHRSVSVAPPTEFVHDSEFELWVTWGDRTWWSVAKSSFRDGRIHQNSMPPTTCTILLRQAGSYVAYGRLNMTQDDATEVDWIPLGSSNPWPESIPARPRD